MSEVMACSETARKQTRQLTNVGDYVDMSLHIPQPYMGSGPIKLVVIGQDPTIQQVASRGKITTVLNLNRSGSLRTYIADICARLGISLDQHVYATNACKCFFNDPPTTILKQNQVDVLDASAHIWLPVLQQELAQFPDAVVISLGEPVLAMLVPDEYRIPIRDYWGYHKRWKEGTFAPMRITTAAESRVGRAIIPMVHQPTQRGARTLFYRERRDAYFAYLRQSGYIPSV
ncbi:uracil-DNA glycosylase family protein [Oscillochloris sp. ZM17-4]|uniref:uracil-DNA glycosylase family protein n=1 Tax=Oscillochloris sp. ZM17-4 TaxID=2866714 RepID=UPI001C72F4B2|nr:uracil-DNA glycosylase family protein [Oscillochloris sp. ZM17-4]MBX0331269.1 uracil-DNA glycosylase family protein [Oscillochloris sp. ZM17-4]